MSACNKRPVNCSGPVGSVQQTQAVAGPAWQQRCLMPPESLPTASCCRSRGCLAHDAVRLRRHLLQLCDCGCVQAGVLGIWAARRAHADGLAPQQLDLVQQVAPGWHRRRCFGQLGAFHLQTVGCGPGFGWCTFSHPGHGSCARCIATLNPCTSCH